MKYKSNTIAQNEFYWGVGTSAFQIEGSPLADGACESDWYRLTHMPGKIVSGDNADIACDHYKRWSEDITIMRDMGVNAYRFSIAWPRIMIGPGRINQKGLDFYSRLIDGLGEAGIEPFVTMFHWDLPGWLDDRGGWVNNESISHFTEYAKVLFDNYSDRVKYWITLNEPYVYYHSYVSGWHWPFETNRYDKLLLCFDNMLRGHQNAVNLCPGLIGVVLSYNLLRPASQSDEDIQAAKLADGVRNRWFLDRIMTGRYPKDILDLHGELVPISCREDISNGEFCKPDFIGLNYYSTGVIRNDPEESVYKFSTIANDFELQPIVENYPAGLYEMVKRVNRDYGDIDLFITENGFLENASNGKIQTLLDDDHRLEYLKLHVQQVLRCIQDGFPLKGYIFWSLLDNFEWRWGLDRLFGLVHVDKQTQKRTLKKSAYWYRDFIRTQKLSGKYISHSTIKASV